MTTVFREPYSPDSFIAPINSYNSSGFSGNPIETNEKPMKKMRNEKINGKHEKTNGKYEKIK